MFGLLAKVPMRAFAEIAFTRIPAEIGVTFMKNEGQSMTKDTVAIRSVAPADESGTMVKKLLSPANVFYEWNADGGAFFKEAAALITKLSAEKAALEAELNESIEHCKSIRDEYALFRIKHTELEAKLKALEPKPQEPT